MSIDTDLLGQIEQIVDTRKNEPSVCCFFDENYNSAFENKVLFTNESNIMVLVARKKQFSILLNKTWFDIKKIDHPKEDSLEIIFKDKISFKIENKRVEVILKTILQYMYNILTDKEMPEVDLFEFDYTLLQKSQFALYHRFKAIILTENVQTPDDLIERLHDFVRANCDSIDVYTLDPHGAHIPYILRSLQVDTKIKTLIVQTPLKGCLWKDLGDFVSYNTSIHHIISYEPLTQDFQHFVAGFKKNPRSKINQLSILRAKITKKYNEMLANLINIHPLDTLCIANSLLGPTAIDFLYVFEKSPNMQKLQTLTLDGTKGIDISLMLRVTKNLKTLSVCNCQLELSLLFGFLAYEKETHLEKLIANFNRARVNINEKLELPPTIKEINLRGIEFQGDNLLHILQITNKHPLTLDVSKAELHQNAWQRLMASYDSIEDPKFTGFGWSDNPIDLETLDFFDRCTHLEYLYLGSSFDPQNKNFLEILNFLATNNSIKRLDFSCAQNNQTNPATLSVVISPLRENKHLREIDLSGNSVNNTTLQTLCDVLMANRAIRKATFSTIEVYDADVFKNFYAKLAQRGVPLDIPVPSFDISRFLIQKFIREYAAQTIEKNVETIIHGDPSIKVPIEMTTPATECPRKRRVPAYGEQKIPTDEEVIRNTPETEPQVWDLLQPQVPHVSDEFYVSLMKQSYDIDSLVSSIIDG